MPPLPMLRRIAGLAALALWVASLALPVNWNCSLPRLVDYGAIMFALGWIGIWLLQFGWLANLFMLLNIYRLLHGRRAGLLTAPLSLAMAASAYWFKEYPDFERGATSNSADTVRAFGRGRAAPCYLRLPPSWKRSPIPGKGARTRQHLVHKAKMACILATPLCPIARSARPFLAFGACRSRRPTGGRASILSTPMKKPCQATKF